MADGLLSLLESTLFVRETELNSCGRQKNIFLLFKKGKYLMVSPWRSVAGKYLFCSFFSFYWRGEGGGGRGEGGREQAISICFREF
jgi:hypothetical protein